MKETMLQEHLDIKTRLKVINNITKTVRFDERRAVRDKLPENSRVRFLAEIALCGLTDPNGINLRYPSSADELIVQTRILRGGVRTHIFDANPLPAAKAMRERCEQG
jgi:hypothetical protein